MTDYSLDTIGRRLRGENLTEQETILAADDKLRVDWILSQFSDEDNGRIVDIGASDGAVSAAVHRKIWTHPWMIEPHPAHQQSLAARAADHCAWVSFKTAGVALTNLPPQWFGTALLCEVMEHYEREGALLLLRLAQRAARRVIVTVPNVNSQSFEASGRHRWDWPDHKTNYNAGMLAQDLDVDVSEIQPIVGLSIDDSIWLGAVVSRA